MKTKSITAPTISDHQTSLLIIKPLSIGRGDGPKILSDLLKNCPIVLTQFREWKICNQTLLALCNSDKLDYEQETIYLSRSVPSWICQFDSTTTEEHPVDILEQYCGPLERTEWTSKTLRFKFNKSNHPTDTVVHIASKERTLLEISLLI